MQSLISITFDDGFRCQFERALPVLDSYGLKATFFLIANDLPTHDRYTGLHDNDWWKIDWRADDIAMLKEVAAGGHEIGSHSVSHHPDLLPIQPELEARESKRLIETRLGIKVFSFCYPFYWSHSCLAEAVKGAGYEQARGGGAPPGYVPSASYYTISGGTALDRFNVDCRQISECENVRGWVREGCWHVLTYHGIGGDQDGWEPVTAEQFSSQMADLAGLRDSGAVEVVTFKDGASRISRQRGPGFELS
ncbi:MAG TPA: polysaccharide deacetylase family protein [Candidatus Sulfotelmatobacter sp.]|nr:polysaccharide deacetylase family protein [Candidatus Sulfotelmatobacter sp.]